MAFRQLIDELHDRLRAQGWSDVRPAFGFVLLAARDSPTTSTEVATLLGTTKQAASKLIDVMAAAGYLQRRNDAEDARRRPVHLTPRGATLLDTVEHIYADIEQEWVTLVGGTNVTRMRSILTRVLMAANDGQLPPVRPSW